MRQVVVQNGGTTVKEATPVRKSGGSYHVPSVWSQIIQIFLWHPVKLNVNSTGITLGPKVLAELGYLKFL
jgi:hypothetical protein